MPKASQRDSANLTQSVKELQINEDDELQKASRVSLSLPGLANSVSSSSVRSQEINRWNRNNPAFKSDVLAISNSDAAHQSPPKETAFPKRTSLPQVKPERSSSKSAAEPSATDDDWESMFDDDGECLDPKIIDEISAAVGKVSIAKPKSDYKETHQQTVNLEDEEFPHVLEVSNFPVEFKTPDLLMVFSEYKEAGFDIKWVDDTHALAVFSSSKCGKFALRSCRRRLLTVVLRAFQLLRC